MHWQSVFRKLALLSKFVIFAAFSFSCWIEWSVSTALLTLIEKFKSCSQSKLIVFQIKHKLFTCCFGVISGKSVPQQVCGFPYRPRPFFLHCSLYFQLPSPSRVWKFSFHVLSYLARFSASFLSHSQIRLSHVSGLFTKIQFEFIWEMVSGLVARERFLNLVVLSLRMSVVTLSMYRYEYLLNYALF